jgi:sigma-B regulation protein RsbU (phosphoserine phosphatase)
VQQKLLPAEAPPMRGLDVHGFSAYCDETGGDYYDYLLPDETLAGDGPVLFVIADVMGHGIASALGMASARAILKAREHDAAPLGALMAALNDLLVPEMGGRRFITMLLLQIDAARRTATWTAAGHDPAIVYDPQTDTFGETGYGGIPLGIDQGETYEQHTYAMLRPGQVIVLGTDGVWDTTDATGDFFGQTRVKEIVRENFKRSSREIAEAIRTATESFRGNRPQRDDVTLVVIKVI